MNLRKGADFDLRFVARSIMIPHDGKSSLSCCAGPWGRWPRLQAQPGSRDKCWFSAHDRLFPVGLRVE